MEGNYRPRCKNCGRAVNFETDRLKGSMAATMTTKPNEVEHEDCDYPAQLQEARA